MQMSSYITGCYTTAAQLNNLQSLHPLMKLVHKLEEIAVK